MMEGTNVNRNMSKIAWFALACWFGLTFSERSSIRAQDNGRAAGNAVGIFEGHGDVGRVLHAGTVEYDAAKQTYTVAGSGENIWFDKDAFQFAWKKMSGDVTLTADVSFLGKGGEEYKKAVLMIRQSLETDSSYADVALHGKGLASLQYRDDKGADTQEIQANVTAPERLRIVKRGDHFSMWLVDENGRFQPATGSARVVLKEPFYVGIGMCSHNDNVVEKAAFSKVELKSGPERASVEGTANSLLEIVSAASTDRPVVYIAPERFEAQNRMPDGK
jgi:TolB protein